MKYIKSKWDMFITESFKLFYFWILGVFILQLFRVIFIFIYKNKIEDNTSINDFLSAFSMGFKFDTHAVMLFLLIPFLANIFIWTKNREKIVSAIRVIFSYLFLAVSLFLSIVTISYFKEYDSQFNYYLFNGLYDDKMAIAKTIMQEYHPILSLILFTILFLISVKITNRLYKIETDISFFQNRSFLFKITTSLIILALVIFATRGALGTNRPAIRKWADVTKDSFLNKTIINPIRSAIYAYKDYRKLQTIGGKNPFLDNKETLSLTIAQKVVSKNMIKPPKHIILVVMESYDAWPLQKSYEELHLTDNLKTLANKGIWFKYFLPAAHSTMNSLASIISGLPYAGVNISILKSTTKIEDTSIYKQFKELGYETYFFYGGFSSWQNIGNFVKNQGAEHIFTATSSGGRTKSGVWGIDDDQLFDLVIKTLKNKEKTFSIIMTTSYHPPYTIDVQKHGFPYKSKEDYPKKFQKLNDGSLSVAALGHLWFSDYAIGNFVKEFEKKEKNILFAFTGDHYGRRYFHSKPNLYEYSCVPFILYGAGIKREMIDTSVVGSHIDIAPTLIDLIASKGFKYKSFGSSMQSKDRDSISIAYKRVLQNQTIFEIKSKNSCRSWNNSKKTENNSVSKDILKEYYNYMAMAWSYTINNNLDKNISKGGK